MGCAASSIVKDERVQVCKERKRLMKQLVGFRGEFADAQLTYLRALRNTGSTLRQFTESETLELETTPYGLVLPPSPPPPLPPSPPPLPFSPDLRKLNDNTQEEEEEDVITLREEEIHVIDEGDSSTTPPPPMSLSSFRDSDRREMVGPVEEEKWAETNTEFKEEGREEEDFNEPQCVMVNDDESSTVSSLSGSSKDAMDVSMVFRKSKRKTLEAIVKELDDYFLKGSSGIKEIVVLMDMGSGDSLLPHNFKENNRKRHNSAKVCNALSWSWSFRSAPSSADLVDICGPSEPCKPGAHSITLNKLYAAEKRLYKEVKEEGVIKVEHERKSNLLQKQEYENHDGIRTDKMRLSVESLETDLINLEQSISRTCSCISTLIDDELYPQLIALTSGLMHMWRTMCECHQVQNHISLQLTHLTDNQSINFSTSYHRQATAQLETAVMAWYNSFCKLVKSQQEYVRTLCKWIKLTHGFVDDQERSIYSSVANSLCEQWQLALDRLPDKVVSEAIKNLLSSINSILLQQVEEQDLQKKYEKLGKRLQKETDSLAEMEHNFKEHFSGGDENGLSPKNPLLLKRTKTEALKQQVDIEKAKYGNSVQVSRTMTLSKLKTCLPNVFQALVRFSNDSIEALEAACSHVTMEDHRSIELEN